MKVNPSTSHFPQEERMGEFKSESGKTGVLLLKVSLFILIFSSLSFPSSSVFGIPVKHLAFILSLFSLFVQWLNGVRISLPILGLFVTTTVFIAFFMLLGNVKAVAYFGFIWAEGLLFFTTICIVLVVLAARSTRQVTDEELIAYAFYGVFVFALWKSSVSLLLSVKILSYPDVMIFFQKKMSYVPVTDIIYGQLYRFNLIVFDFIVSAFLFYVPTYPKLFVKVPKVLRYLYLVVGTMCLVFAFSRLLFALVALLWGYAFLFKFSFRARLVAVFVVAGVLMTSLPWLEGAYEERFLGKKAAFSDSFRVAQTLTLLETWEKVPLLGGGMGYYAKDMIRDPRVAYSYEVQWVSFLPKFGLLGMSYLLLLVVLLFREILKGKRTLDHYVVASVLLAFILGGFTNQYLLNSGSGMFYALHVLFAQVLRAGCSSSGREVYPTSLNA